MPARARAGPVDKSSRDSVTRQVPSRSNSLLGTSNHRGFPFSPVPRLRYRTPIAAARRSGNTGIGRFTIFAMRRRQFAGVLGRLQGATPHLFLCHARTGASEGRAYTAAGQAIVPRKKSRTDGSGTESYEFILGFCLLPIRFPRPAGFWSVSPRRWLPAVKSPCRAVSAIATGRGFRDSFPQARPGGLPHRPARRQ